MVNDEIIIESINPQSQVYDKCPHCNSAVKYSQLKTDKSLKIKCYNCESYFSPNQKQSKTEDVKEIIKFSNIIDKFRKPGIDTDKNPCETEYYEILGVSPTATQEEISKAYHDIIANIYINNEKTKVKIENTSKVYKILSDPEKRSEYNRYGKNFVNDLKKFLKQQFGGDLFNDYIGDLIYVTLDDFIEIINGDKIHLKNPTEKEKIRKKGKKQEERVKELTEKLIKKIEMYIKYVRPFYDNDKQLKGKEEEYISRFKIIIKVEAKKLKHEGYGIELLHLISYIYKLKANQALQQLNIENGDIFQRINGYKNKFTSKMKEKNHLFFDVINTSKSANAYHKYHKKIQNQDKMNAGDEFLTEEEKKKVRNSLQQKATINWMDSFWQCFKYVIEKTLIKVCNRIFYDTTVSSKEIKERINAILIISEVFRKTVISNTDNNNTSQKEIDTFDSYLGSWLIV